MRADDYRSAHRVEPGDIISADMVNELFENVEGFRQTVTEDDLLGTWKGEAYAADAGQPEWQSGPAANYYVLTNVVMTFSKEGEYYRIVTSAPDPFQTEYAAAHNHYFSVKGGVFFAGRNPFPRIIDRISPTRIRFLCSTPYTPGGYMTPGPSYLILLDRQDIPPEKPHLVSVAVSNLDVVLTWQDNSSDEEGFNVLRKDSLSGTYAPVGAVVSNTVCCTNPVPTPGLYWYRIVASNTCGSSLGSNVKKVVVP